MDTHTQVKAADVVAMFAADLEMAMTFAAASQVYVMVGWLPPANPHTNFIEVHAQSFGRSADPVVKDRVVRLLNQVASCVQQKRPVVFDELLVNHGQHFGHAIESDVVVVCVSDSEMFADDFCARLAENIHDESIRALAS